MITQTTHSYSIHILVAIGIGLVFGLILGFIVGRNRPRTRQRRLWRGAPPAAPGSPMPRSPKLPPNDGPEASPTRWVPSGGPQPSGGPLSQQTAAHRRYGEQRPYDE